MSPRILSLCSGYGGLDLAAEAAFNAVTITHAEYEEAPSKVLAARWPGVPNLGDITAADWSSIDADIITSGYPCQPFSHAGRRKGTADERHLWPHVAEAIRGVRPRYVVLENVAGHRSLGFDTVLGDLAAMRYVGSWISLRASDIGACHGRERVFILARDADRLAGETPRAFRGRPGPMDGPGPIERAVGSDRLHHASDATGDRWGEGWPESARLIGRPDAAERRRAVAADTADGGHAVGVRGGHTTREPEPPRDRDAAANTDLDERARERHQQSRRAATAGRGAINWGQYEPAIRRWEHVLGRVAPAPTETGRNGGQRLSPRFVEWMQGLTDGWVTDVPDISRNAQLKMLGNGVVPPQAHAAIITLTRRTAVAA